MFMRVNSRCAHQARPPLGPGAVRVTRRGGMVGKRVDLPTVELTRRAVSEGAGSDHA